MREVKGSYMLLYQRIAYSFQFKGISSQGVHYMSYLIWYL